MLLIPLHRLAVRLFPFRYLCLIMAATGLTVGLYAAISDNDDLHSWTLRLSLVFSLWSLMLFAGVQLFRQLPPPVLPGLRLLERIKDRLHLVFCQFLAIGMVLLTAFLLFVSFKLLTV